MRLAKATHRQSGEVIGAWWHHSFLQSRQAPMLPLTVPILACWLLSLLFAFSIKVPTPYQSLTLSPALTPSQTPLSLKLLRIRLQLCQPSSPFLPEGPRICKGLSLPPWLDPSHPSGPSLTTTSSVGALLCHPIHSSTPHPPNPISITVLYFFHSTHQISETLRCTFLN